MDQGMKIPAWDPSTRWAEAGRSCVQCQPGLHTKTLSQKKNNEIRVIKKHPKAKATLVRDPRSVSSKAVMIFPSYYQYDCERR